MHTDVSAFWATLIYIILKVQMRLPPPQIPLEFYGGPGGHPYVFIVVFIHFSLRLSLSITIGCFYEISKQLY